MLVQIWIAQNFTFCQKLHSIAIVMDLLQQFRDSAAAGLLQRQNSLQVEV